MTCFESEIKINLEKKSVIIPKKKLNFLNSVEKIKIAC